MKQKILESDNFIDPAIGVQISFHAIRWQNLEAPAPVLPVGGNLHYHTLPLTGTRPHTHEFCEIILVLSGSLEHKVNGDFQPLGTGDAVFVRPNDVHSFTPGRNALPCELILLSFNLDFFVAVSRYLEDDSFLHAYTETVLPAILHLSENRMNQLSVRLLRLNSGDIAPAMQRIELKVIFMELFTECFLRLDHAAAHAPKWLAVLCEKMKKKENFIAGTGRLQQLSGYTPEYLCAVFRRELGKTPTEFVNELKMNCAAQLLTDTELPPDEIAQSLNIRSLSRFYHLFRTAFNCTPRSYRNRARSGKRLI